MLDHIPCGLTEIRQVFGCPEDPDFKLNLITFTLPYPLLYMGKPVPRATGHRLARDHFVAALEGVKAAGLADQVQNYGGIYAPRSMRGIANCPSTHTWGIAIDLEPECYPLGSDERFPDEIVEIFRKFGFFYGGDFTRRKDPMHFQLCTGY